NQRAIGIAEPEPVRFEPLGRIEAVDPQRLKPLAEPADIVLERAERCIVELFAGTLGECAPTVRLPVGVKGELAALFLGVETEQAIELFRLGQIRDHQAEMVERVNAKLAGTARRRLGHRTNLGHSGYPS